VTRSGPSHLPSSRSVDPLACDLPGPGIGHREAVPSEAPGADHVAEYRDEAANALAAIAGLPHALREAATLFFVHECSHQDIATFLGLSVPTVNNRLHAARKQLRRRMLTMLKDTLQAHGLPDDFATTPRLPAASARP